MLQIKEQTPSCTYELVTRRATEPPDSWGKPCTSEECSFHQLSPYIGKLKSTIARDLIATYSRPGELVADVFCGSGTIPLETVILGRRAFAVDASTYAITLTKGKLFAPHTKGDAYAAAERVMAYAGSLPAPDLRKVPAWVRSFFHPETLREALRFRNACLEQGSDFLMACFLGILHHQRPGFLSYPSSHLVPYLRDKKFPRKKFPDLYEYRPLRPRLLAKIDRAYKRAPLLGMERSDTCQMGLAQSISLPANLDCLITSPPYMNALDYGRDNRLRMWFLGEANTELVDNQTVGFDGYRHAIISLGIELERKLKVGGYAVFVIGDKSVRKGRSYPSAELARIFSAHAPSLKLMEVIADTIPDIRRSRRHLAGVKKEHTLVYRKEQG